MLQQMEDMERAAYPGIEQEILAARPDLDSAMEMVIECLNVLEGERALGFGAVGLIPFRAIAAWADFHGIDHDLTDMLITVITRLDAERARRDAAARALKEKR